MYVSVDSLFYYANILKTSWFIEVLLHNDNDMKNKCTANHSK